MNSDSVKGAEQKVTPAGIIILTLWSLLLIAMVVEVILDIRGIIMASTILLFLGSIVAIRLLMAKKIRSAEDERIRKLDAYARGNAWSISMVLVAILYILLSFNVIALDGFLIIFMVFAVMGWSWMLFKGYYYFKGDVE